MSKQIQGLRCPHCKKKVNFGDQMQEWDVDYGADVPIDDPENAWAMIMVFCHNCEQYAFTIDLNGEFTDEEQAPESIRKETGAKTILFPKNKKPRN